jgi:hypothetical protein
MIFEVTPEHIEVLSDADLRTLVGYLAEQEVVRAGHSASNVTYGGHQNAKDGGIDVRVDLGGGAIEGYIPRGQTGFQVKAEDMPKGAIQQEMRKSGKLRTSIMKLGEVGGAYIIVSSKGSVADTSLSTRRNAIAEAIADAPSASGLHVDFYDRRRVASWVNQHPGLIPWVRSRIGLPLSGWRPFEDWSSSPGAINEDYLTDDHIRLVGASLKDTDGLSAGAGVNKLREILSKPKGTIRLVGLSGVGKTRLAQALFDEMIGINALSPHLAVYTDMADAPDPVPLELLSRIQHLGQRCVLIVDNCGVDLHRKLTARMNNGQTAVSLLTIEYDISDDEPENTDTFKLEPASSEIIEKVIKRRYPKLTSPEIGTIAAFSEGNSRIALALAETAQEGESLANLQDNGLIKRLFHQNHRENHDLLRAAKTCSLVYSFDGETLEGDEAELPILAAVAEQTVSQMHGHIAELYRRQLVQKRSKWRAILPHALAHKLAKQALQDIPADTLKQRLVNVAPERLLKSFSRRLGCLHDSPEAQVIVAGWLGSGGRLAKIEKLDQVGIILLDNIAPVNPDAVMKSIQQSVKQGNALFDNANSHRGKIVGLLRSLAYEANSFDEAALLIGKFARSVRESNSMGEAINVFKSLFFLYLSGTHASATQRVDFLKNLAQSGDPSDHALVLAGLDAMLECTHFSSSYGFEFGARKRNYGLHPKNRKEVADWYRTALGLAGDLASLPELYESVRSMIASQFRFLAPKTVLTDELIALADRFASNGGWPQGWAGARAAARQAKITNRKDDAAKLEALASRLKPESLHERISSYVLPEQWGALDIAEADFDDEKQYAKIQEQVDAVCSGIGMELADDLQALILHLPLMLKSQSTRVSTVAKSLGHEVADARAAWDIIIAEVLSSNHQGTMFGFPSFFLSGLAERNKTMAGDLLDEALTTTALHPFFVHMQTVVGVDVRGCERIIEATKFESVPVYTFRMLRMGRACNGLSGSDFKRLVLAIAGLEGGLEMAFEILQMRLFSKKVDKLPLESDEKDTGRILLSSVKFEKRKQNDETTLAEVVSTCLRSPADDVLVEQLCQRLLEGIAQRKVCAMDYGKLITELGALFPRVVLNVLVERNTAAMEDRHSIFRSIREYRSCPLRKINDDVLLEWAHERPESRFFKLAEVIRPWRRTEGTGANDDAPDDETGPFQWTDAAIRILREAPEPLKILSQYIESFSPSCYSGSLAAILASRLSLLERLTQDADSAIASAAKNAVISYRDEIERVREGEASHDRNRDERFEW